MRTAAYPKNSSPRRISLIVRNMPECTEICQYHRKAQQLPPPG
ncbi:hypothetical protein [Paenibacillus lautus]|nr:hypothetical protein [Paenibacillus lautus]MEC0254349.1 hypothetical protein [Paenibacillus lautus]